MSDNSLLVKPMINSNGSSAKDLAERYRNAGVAIEKALDAIALTAPHGRDYYMLGDAALNVALAQHRARIEKLDAVANEFRDLFAYVERFSKIEVL